MKMPPKSIGLVAWVAIGIVCLIYGPMAIEYMAQYFNPNAPELYLRSISAVISLNPASQVGSLVHHQVQTYVNSRSIMLVHTAAAGLALLLGMLQFSARVRRNWPVLHRLSGRLMLIIVAASMVLALAFLFRTGSAAATSGPPRSSGSSSFLSWWACLTRALTVFVMDRSRAERFLLASLALVREGMMHSRSILFLVGLVASGMLTAITPHQALAAPAPQPLVTVVASSTNSAIEKVYYYRGRYYRYRYGGRYYAHRYYNGGRWRYY